MLQIMYDKTLFKNSGTYLLKIIWFKKYFPVIQIVTGNVCNANLITKQTTKIFSLCKCL